MRLAWFSPLPPVKTGIAACSADLAAVLRRRGHTVDLYPAERAHDFPWRHRQEPYNLIVYQFGNSSHHDYQWAYALRYPGLVVLHDTHLHHARAAFLLREKRADDYRAEFRWSHPDVSAGAAELAVAGFSSPLYYEWPMVRGLVEGSRMVAVHGEGARCGLLESRLRQGFGAVSIRLGHGQLVAAEDRQEARRRIRARHGIFDDAIVFGVFGGLTPEKRIPQVLRALRALVPYAPGARLLLGGAPAAHYDVVADIAALGLEDRVTLTGYLDTDAELTEHLAACDVSLNMRWPTARETSGPWLRALAAGIATVITDLVHLGDVPSLDPRTWVKNEEVGGRRSEVGGATSECGGPAPPSSALRPPSSVLRPPVCVAIDILDEDHSLRLAMRRLAADADLRSQLGGAGQAWWAREHSVEVMADDYERVMKDAAARPDPRVTLPPHMRDAGDTKIDALLAPLGLESPI
jgi:glycosyltransferase involved in cell wall biosynthesis